MKIKKLLSMGAVVLALTCFTSIGASAVTIPSNADLIKIVVNQYENGKNPTGLFSGDDKDTKISVIFSQEVLDEIDAELSPNYKKVDKLVTKIEKNKDNTVATVIDKLTKDEATFNKYKTKFIAVAQKVQAMDSKVGTDRIAAEQKIVDIVKKYDSSLDVIFGKDSEGKTAACILKNGKIIVEFNSDNLQTVIDRVNSITWAQVSAAKALLTEEAK